MSSMYKDKSSKHKKNRSFKEYVEYIMLGDGHHFGDRAALHECGEKRGIQDPQIWTHFLFLIGGYLCFKNGLYDMLILICIVIPLSTCYHYSYEQPGIIAQTEAVSAKVLFAYGFLQLFHSDVPLVVLLGEIAMLVLTVFTFVYTNVYVDTYDPWHSMLHVASAIWSILVASYHGPLINL